MNRVSICIDVKLSVSETVQWAYKQCNFTLTARDLNLCGRPNAGLHFCGTRHLRGTKKCNKLLRKNCPFSNMLWTNNLWRIRFKMTNIYHETASQLQWFAGDSAHCDDVVHNGPTGGHMLMTHLEKLWSGRGFRYKADVHRLSCCINIYWFRKRTQRKCEGY